MAKSKGMISISGKLGGLIFSHRKGNEYIKREPLLPVAQTVATKKSAVDFGQAIQLSGRIARAFAPLVLDYTDGELVPRLRKRVMAVFKTIDRAQVGRKHAADGNLALLEGFQLNSVTTLDNLLWRKPVLKIDVNSGLAVAFAASAVKGMFKAKRHASAAVLEVVVAIFNLDDGTEQLLQGKKLTIKLEEGEFKGATLRLPLVFSGRQLVVLGVGLHYMDGTTRFLGEKDRAAALIEAKLLNDGEWVAFTPVATEKSEAPVVDEGLDWEA